MVPSAPPSPPSPLSAESLREVPIFPLPEAALFPHTLLPLHIFEPRYREMMAWVLDHAAPLVIAQLKPGFEADYLGRPPIYEVCGIGRVLEHTRLPDGRYTLMLEGVARVKLEEELPERGLPFRLGRFSVVPDEACPTGEVSSRLATLRALLLTMTGSRPRLASMLSEVLDRTPAPEAACDVLSSMVLEGGAARQEVLECRRLDQRIDRVLDAVIGLLPELDADGDAS